MISMGFRWNLAMRHGNEKGGKDIQRASSITRSTGPTSDRTGWRCGLREDICGRHTEENYSKDLCKHLVLSFRFAEASEQRKE